MRERARGITKRNLSAGKSTGNTRIVVILRDGSRWVVWVIYINNFRTDTENHLNPFLTMRCYRSNDALKAPPLASPILNAKRRCVACRCCSTRVSVCYCYGQVHLPVRCGLCARMQITSFSTPRHTKNSMTALEDLRAF